MHQADDRHLVQRRPGKRPPAWSMRALGKGTLPETVEIAGRTWRLVRTHKHDFWAATGFYEDAAGERAVVKVSRTESFAGVPLAFVGRWLCRREMRFYQRLGDLPNVPTLLGRIGTTGFMHAFVPGQPLSRDRPVPDGFFDQLRALIAELHRRDIAYVDANKPENILVGDDGLPHLIDFQISGDLFEWGNNRANRWWLRRLMRADIYHILKHKKRLRPDELTDEERRIVERRGPLIQLHRVLVMPYKRIRRTTFKRLRESGRLLPAGSK